MSNDLKYQGMEVSAAQFLQGSMPVSNDHIHDNRYYTKAEIEEKLEQKDDVKTGILSSGTGIKSFKFNGKQDAVVELDFAELGVDNSFGTSAKPARFDHYHQKLFTGFGFKPTVYDGSKEITFEIDEEVLSREILTNGPGIKDFIYNGSDPAIISADFGDKTELSGVVDLVARKDHKHHSLTAGSGIAALNYDTSKNAIIQVAWDDRTPAEHSGTSELVARSDHGHTTVNKIVGEGEWLADVKLSTNGTNIELTRTFRKSIVEGALTEGGVAFSVGNAEGLIYDYTAHEAFICTTKLDVEDSTKEIEKRGSGIIYDLFRQDTYRFDGTKWESIVAPRLRPGRFYCNPITQKGFYQFPDRLEQLWDYVGSGQPHEAFICFDKFDVKDSKKYVEKERTEGKILDIENDVTWIWNGSEWSKVPGYYLRPNELYINPATEKGFFVKEDETIVELWKNSGTKLDFAYVCENEEDFIDSKEDIELKNSEDEELRYIYDVQTNTAWFYTGQEWIQDPTKELRNGRAYANSATGKGFLYKDEKVQKLWESSKVKPPTFSYICESEEDTWESKRVIEHAEILDEADSFIYNIYNGTVEQWTGLQWISLTKKLRNWTTYVNTTTGKGFFTYPDTVKKLWGEDPRLPITIRKGSLNCSEIQILRDSSIIYDEKFSWLKNGAITIDELLALSITTSPKFSWLYLGTFDVESLAAQNYKFNGADLESNCPIVIRYSSITTDEIEEAAYTAIIGSKPSYFETGSFTVESLIEALKARVIKNVQWGSYTSEILENLTFKSAPKDIYADRLIATIRNRAINSEDLNELMNSAIIQQGAQTVYNRGFTVAELTLYEELNIEGVKTGSYTIDDLETCTFDISYKSTSDISAIIHKGQLTIDRFEDLKNTAFIGTNDIVQHRALTITDLLENQKITVDWLKAGSFTIDDLEEYSGFTNVKDDASQIPAIIQKGQLTVEKFVELENTGILGYNDVVHYGSLTVTDLIELYNQKIEEDWLKVGSFTVADIEEYSGFTNVKNDNGSLPTIIQKGQITVNDFEKLENTTVIGINDTVKHKALSVADLIEQNRQKIDEDWLRIGSFTVETLADYDGFTNVQDKSEDLPTIIQKGQMTVEAFEALQNATVIGSNDIVHHSTLTVAGFIERERQHYLADWLHYGTFTLESVKEYSGFTNVKQDNSNIPAIIQKGQMTVDGFEQLQNSLVVGTNNNFVQHHALSVVDFIERERQHYSEDWLHYGTFTLESIAEYSSFTNVKNENSSVPTIIQKGQLTIEAFEALQNATVIGSNDIVQHRALGIADFIERERQHYPADWLYYGTYDVKSVEEYSGFTNVNNSSAQSSTIIQKGQLTINDFINLQNAAVIGSNDIVQHRALTVADLVERIKQGIDETDWLKNRSYSVDDVKEYEGFSNVKPFEAKIPTLIHKGQLNLEKYIDLQKVTYIGTNDFVKHGALTTEDVKEMQNQRYLSDWIKNGSFTAEELENSKDLLEEKVTEPKIKNSFDINSLENINALTLNDIEDSPLTKYSIEQVEDLDVNAQYSMKELSNSTGTPLTSNEVKQMNITQLQTKDI